MVSMKNMKIWFVPCKKFPTLWWSQVLLFYHNIIALIIYSKCNLISVDCRLAHSAFSVMLKLPEFHCSIWFWFAEEKWHLKTDSEAPQMDVKNAMLYCTPEPNLRICTNIGAIEVIFDYHEFRWPWVVFEGEKSSCQFQHVSIEMP